MLWLSIVCEWGVGEVGHLVRDLEVLLCPFPLGNKSCPVKWTKSKLFLKKRSHWPIRCMNSIYTEGANFITMTRQLGNNTVKERKFTNNLGKWRGAAENSLVGCLSFWPTLGQIQNRVTVKLNVCVMPPNACDTLQYTIEEIKWQQSFLF